MASFSGASRWVRPTEEATEKHRVPKIFGDMVVMPNIADLTASGKIECL